MSHTIIKNARIINRGKIFEGDLWIHKNRIHKIDSVIQKDNATEIDAKGFLLMPGIIDDQVHFREPGLTYKANIHTESRAGIAGGVTTFMEMPNTKPPALTQSLLQDKYDIAKEFAFANYSFYMGASNDNIEEVLKTNSKDVCGIKVFMGSSTGNMLVDDHNTLDNIFSRSPMLIATHCEDEQTIRQNMDRYKDKFGDQIDASMHPEIRNVQGCLRSSRMAVDLAKKHNARLHILHISTKDELDLFDNKLSLEDKKITSEVCVHHLYFNSDDYQTHGNKIKCNPAIKGKDHQQSLFPALLDNRLDIIATDHAPHTKEEKSKVYLDAPSGLPLVQHSINIMLGFHQKGMISLERMVEKMCHAPAVCFKLADRGFLDEGKFADLVIVDPDEVWQVGSSNIYYKCGWSPLESETFRGRVKQTFVNGQLIFDNGEFGPPGEGMRLTFNR